jgi:hypothetical protein
MELVLIVGIDPGKKGAFVAIEAATGLYIDSWDMPLVNKKIEPEGIRTIYREIRLYGKNPHFMVEKPHSRPTDGRVGLATYHWEAGQLMMLVAWGWSYQLIQPKIWAKHMHLGLPAELKPKQKSLMAFTRLYPGLAKDDNFVQGRKIFDGKIDALLIAEFGRRLRNGAELTVG